VISVVRPQSKMSNLRIKVDRKKAAKRWAPFWSVCLTLLAFTMYTDSLGDDVACRHLFGFNVTYLNIVLVSYILPFLLFIASLIVARIGYKELKYGFSPPLDSVALVREKEVKTGKWVRIKGGVCVLIPLYCIYVMYLGSTIYSEMAKGLSYQEMVYEIEKECE
jgi:hypothetical protein